MTGRNLRTQRRMRERTLGRNGQGQHGVDLSSPCVPCVDEWSVATATDRRVRLVEGADVRWRSSRVSLGVDCRSVDEETPFLLAANARVLEFEPHSYDCVSPELPGLFLESWPPSVNGSFQWISPKAESHFLVVRHDSEDVVVLAEISRRRTQRRRLGSVSLGCRADYCRMSERISRWNAPSDCSISRQRERATRAGNEQE